MDIAKLFDVKSSKKRVLSSEQSETGDEPKKQKEGSRNESSTSTLDDVFAEGLKNPDCVLILANCLRSLEQQVKETFDLAKKSSESQIKGELALQDVNKAISFIGEKFDAYEKERRENEKKIEELNGTVSKMNERIEELENKIDRQEQYSRRNCILIHGIAENKEENTDQQAIDFINENLDIKIDEIDIDRSHRIGRYDKTKKKARPIIVKFARYNVRGRVFREKQKLKVTGKTITKSLTTKRIGHLNDAREKYGSNNVWSYDGNILYKTNNKGEVY